MAKKAIRKRLPQLCYNKSTGWWYSIIRDPSHPKGRRYKTWAKKRNEAKKAYNEGIERIVAEYGLREPHTDKYADACSWTITDIAENYFNQKKADGCSTSTLGNIKKYLPRFIKWLFDNGFDPAMKGPSELTTSLLAGYRHGLAENSSIGRIEANHHIEQIRGMLKWGMDTHDLRPPAMGAIRKFSQKAKKGHGKTQDRTPLTWKQIKKLLNAARPVDMALILLGLNCGFGNTDIGSLELTDVDLKQGKISGCRRKTGVSRDFALWEETIAALRTYLTMHRGKTDKKDMNKLFFVSRLGNPMCWEYIDEKGKRHRSDAVKNRFDKLCQRADVSLPYGAGFYILRHTYATMIGQFSSDPREVQAAMAHSTIGQQETYRHDRAMKAQIAQNRLHEVMVSKLPKNLLKRIFGDVAKDFSTRSSYGGRVSGRKAQSDKKPKASKRIPH